MATPNLDDFVNSRLGRPKGTRVTPSDDRRAGVTPAQRRAYNRRAAPVGGPTRPRTGGQRRRDPAPAPGSPRNQGRDQGTNQRFPPRPSYVGNNVPWQYEHGQAYDFQGAPDGNTAADTAGTTVGDPDSYFYNAFYLRGGPFTQKSNNMDVPRGRPGGRAQRINIATFVNGVKRMTDAELTQFQRDLVDLGLLNPGDFDWGVLGAATQTAVENFFLEARASGQSIEKYADSGGAIDDDILGNTADDVNIGTQEIKLSDPDSIITMGQQVAKDILGRDLTDEEKMTLVGRVHSGERTNQEQSIRMTAQAQADENKRTASQGGGQQGDASTSEADRFLNALMGKESGGSAGAVNEDTGAAGLFQIMPGNWDSWARQAGVDPADKSPENQWRVARAKVMQYYRTYGNWRDVAVVWYSGSTAGRNSTKPQGGGKYPSISSYADDVMRRMGDTSNSPTGATKGGVVIGQPFTTEEFDSNAEAEKLLKEKDPKGWSAHRVWQQFDEFSNMLSGLGQ